MTIAHGRPASEREPGIDLHIRDVARDLGILFPAGKPKSWDGLLDTAVGLYWARRPQRDVRNVA